MRLIESSVIIPAPVEAVWRRLTDTARYPAWNPFITELSGRLQVGAKLRVRIVPPGGKPTSFTPTVTVMEDNRRLEWLGRAGITGLFDGRHSFTLERIDERITRMVQAEQFSGLLVPFTGSLLQRTAAGFQAMNEALREECVKAQPTARP
jgi:hypothetical protein